MPAVAQKPPVLRTLAAGLLATVIGACSSSPEPSPAPTPVATEAAPATTALATFTADQVSLGESAFADSCSDCHSAREFRGDDFQFRFRRRTAWNLFQVVTETMPEDAPGSLSGDEYVAIISYILEMNGYEAGATKLEATQEALSKLPLDQVPTTPSGL